MKMEEIKRRDVRRGASTLSDSGWDIYVSIGSFFVNSGSGDKDFVLGFGFGSFECTEWRGFLFQGLIFQSKINNRFFYVYTNETS